MNLKALIDLLRVPTKTYQEHLMVKHLREEGGRRTGVRVWSDEHNNVFMLKGDSTQHLPCVAAHIDSVQPIRNIAVHQRGNYLYGEYNGTPAGMGADDKTGVFTCLELLDRFDHLAVALFAAEEVGARGAYAAAPEFFEKVGYLIEFDCPSKGLVSYSTGGVPLFENQGEFISIAHPVLIAHGSTKWQMHPYTDTMAIRKRFPISCLNLASGYYNWHMPNELVKISDVEQCIEQATQLIRTLGNRRYAFPAAAHQPMEECIHPVTWLEVPKP